MNTFSATVRSGKSRGSWWTTAIPSARDWAGPWIRVGTPSSRIVPLSGWWTPARIFTRVLLPAPFSPTSPWISPARMSIETSVRAAVAPKRFEMPRSSTRGAGAAAAGTVTRRPRSRPGSGSPAPTSGRAAAGSPSGEISTTSTPALRSAATMSAGASSSVKTPVSESVRQNVAEATRPHLVWSTTAKTSRAAATMARLI